MTKWGIRRLTRGAKSLVTRVLEVFGTCAFGRAAVVAVIRAVTEHRHSYNFRSYLAVQNNDVALTSAPEATSHTSWVWQLNNRGKIRDDLQTRRVSCSLWRVVCPWNRVPGTLTDNLRGIPQSVQADSEMQPTTGLERILPNSYVLTN